ncbi:MAG: FAD-dependent oxidoreductase [Vitreoscilla sp.]|nr:FAD-dependent oxidoreductase [Polaromonas sp.]
MAQRAGQGLYLAHRRRGPPDLRLRPAGFGVCRQRLVLQNYRGAEAPARPRFQRHRLDYGRRLCPAPRGPGGQPRREHQLRERPAHLPGPDFARRRPRPAGAHPPGAGRAPLREAGRHAGALHHGEQQHRAQPSPQRVRILRRAHRFDPDGAHRQRLGQRAAQRLAPGRARLLRPAPARYPEPERAADVCRARLGPRAAVGTQRARLGRAVRERLQARGPLGPGAHPDLVRPQRLRGQPPALRVPHHPGNQPRLAHARLPGLRHHGCPAEVWAENQFHCRAQALDGARSKEEFEETLRYFGQRAKLTGVNLHLGKRIDAAQLIAGKYDDVILATGVKPRNPRIPGQDLPGVLSYIDVLLGQQPVGQRVALIGAGGIGFDVAEFLVTPAGHSTAMNLPEWLAEWGVADPGTVRGGVVRPVSSPAVRQVTLLQRKPGKLGNNLGKTTGWIHRAALKMKNVEMLSGVNYERIMQQPGGLGLFITYGEKRTDGTVLEVDTIVLCAGQEPLQELLEPLKTAGINAHLIGGAQEAGELDAKRAIDQGTRLGARL